MGKVTPDRVAESKRAMQKGESRHGKGSESVHDIERVGSPGGTGHTFHMPEDHEVTDHSKVRELD